MTNAPAISKRLLRPGALYVGGLAALAGLSGWFLYTVEESLQTQPAADATTPSLTMDHFTAVRMTAEGIPEYVLSAPHLSQYPDPAGTWLDEPSLDVYENQTLVWMIRSERGWVAPAQAVIRLLDAVTITRPPTSARMPVTITTRDLQVCPEPDPAWQCPAADYAETAAPARLVTPNTVVNSVGLKAYLATDQVELLSQVRGYHESSKPLFHLRSGAADSGSDGP